MQMSEVSEFEAALTKADWMFDHNRTKLATKLSQEGVDSGAFSLILNYLCELDWMFVNNRVEKATHLAKIGVEADEFCGILAALTRVDWMFVNNRVEKATHLAVLAWRQTSSPMASLPR